MSETVGALLGFTAWAVIFVPLVVAWHLPERRRVRRLRAASARRNALVRGRSTR